MTTLIIKLTGTQIATAWIAYIVCWAVLYILVRRHYKKTTKKVKDASKDNTVTFLDDIDVFECQKPHVEYRAGCN